MIVSCIISVYQGGSLDGLIGREKFSKLPYLSKYTHANYFGLFLRFFRSQFSILCLGGGIPSYSLIWIHPRMALRIPNLSNLRIVLQKLTKAGLS